MKTLITLIALFVSASVYAGEQSVLIQTPAPAITTTPTALVADCTNGCCNGKCRLYNEKVTEEDRCRRTLRGGYVKRQVVRKVYTPVR